MLRQALLYSFGVLLALGCSTGARVAPTSDGGSGGLGTSAGGGASGEHGVAGGHAGSGAGSAAAGGSGSSGGAPGVSGSGGDGGASGEAGGGDATANGGVAGATTVGNGGAGSNAGSGAVGGAGGAGNCGPLAVTPCPATTVTQLAAGGGTVCALFFSGKVKCWGANHDGELGYGNTQNIGDDELPSAVGYVNVSSSPGVVVKQISVGNTHACALLSDGTVSCWGKNLFGELGYGDLHNIGDDELPSSVNAISVTSTPGVTVTQISAGGTHTCALLSDGTIKCWGYNGYGQLGSANADNIGDDELPGSVPAVSVSTTPGVTVTQISAGLDHTCALLSDGSVKCWGANQFGQLGRGSSNNLRDPLLPSTAAAIPLTTKPGVVATAIQASVYVSCALLSDGTIKCWGDGAMGLVGTGKTEPVLEPSSVGPVSVTNDPGLTVTEVANGTSHICVRLSDGSCKCWGANVYGQLGYGNTNTIGDDELPSSVGAVSVSTIPSLKIVQLVAGSSFNCALLSDDSVKCWGDNGVGELGNGKKDGYAVGDDELPASVGPVKLL